MWKAEYVMTTDVTPAALYRAITDINNWSEWDTGLEYTRLDGDVKPGAVQARILQPSVPFAPVVDIGNRAVECCGRHVSRHYVLGFPHITTPRGTSGERAWTSAPALLPNGSRLSCGRNGRWCKAGGRQKKSWAALGSFTGHKPVLCTG